MTPPLRQEAFEDPGRRRLAVIAQNLRDLSSRDSIVAAAAGERLGELAPTTGELLNLLNDRDQYIRAGAARRLRHASGDEVPIVVEALRGIVHVSSDRVVEPALGSLGYLRASAARADVRGFLEDRNPRVVHAALYALGRLGSADEGPHLVPFLQSSEHHLVLAALQALVALRCRSAVPAILDRLAQCQGVSRRQRAQFELPRKLINALVTLGATQAAPLLVRMAQEEIGVRGLAVQALIDLAVPEAAPALLPLLARLAEAPHEERLCVSLLNLMVALDYRFALPDIRRFLAHRLPPVRTLAVKIVAAWQDEASVERVRLMCQEDPSAFVRPAAVAALGRLLGVAALADLEALADDSNALVRDTVARTVGRLEPLPPEGLALLERLRADPSAGRSAANALAYQVSQAGQPLPSPTLAFPRPAEVLPPELRHHANAARAFLRSWRAHLTFRAGGHNASLVEAINRLLGVLEEGEEASAA